MNKEIKEKHRVDEEHAMALLEIVRDPLDIPSLERQVFHSIKEPFLSDGYTWSDKPHRILNSAIIEIRALREYILREGKAHQ